IPTTAVPSATRKSSRKVLRAACGRTYWARCGQSAPVPERAMATTVRIGTRTTAAMTIVPPSRNGRRPPRGRAGPVDTDKSVTVALLIWLPSKYEAGRIFSRLPFIHVGSACRAVIKADAVDQLGSLLAVLGNICQREGVRLDFAKGLHRLRDLGAGEKRIFVVLLGVNRLRFLAGEEFHQLDRILLVG